MKHQFQLAYTISPINEDDEADKAAAEKARRRLRNNMGWQTIEDIETTLLGELRLAGGNLDEKARDAKKQIREQIREELHGAELLKRIEFQGSLMVAGLGSAIDFSLP